MLKGIFFDFDGVITLEKQVFELLLWRRGSAVDGCRASGSGCGYGVSPLGGGRH